MLDFSVSRQASVVVLLLCLSICFPCYIGLQGEGGEDGKGNMTWEDARGSGTSGGGGISQSTSGLSDSSDSLTDVCVCVYVCMCYVCVHA